jgi:gluconate kinase
MFFGHPGAGKTTLCRRFGELHGIPSIDTDRFMTPEEREAARIGRYTQAMRLANIRRYCDHVTSGMAGDPHVALADGLPNDAARRFLREQFSAGNVIFVLVHTPRSLWEQRLSTRDDNLVDIGVVQADAYIHDNWEPVLPWLPHEEIENGTDGAATDALLRALFRRYVAPSVLE